MLIGSVFDQFKMPQATGDKRARFGRKSPPPGSEPGDKDQAETSVLFELISARYEHRSLCITANQPFGEWDKVFPDRAMTVAAVDRLVHHSTIFELNVESYRRRTALQRKQQGPGRPASIATPKNVGVPPRQEDQQ